MSIWESSSGSGHGGGVSSVNGATGAVELTTLSLGAYKEPILSDMGDGTITVTSDGVYNFYKNADGTSGIRQLPCSGGNFSFVENENNYLYAAYNNGTPFMATSNSSAVLFDRRNVVLATVYRQGTILEILEWGENGKNLSEALLVRAIVTERFFKISGLSISESPIRTVNSSAGSVYYGINITSMPAASSSTDVTELWTRTAGVWSSTAVTQYNNTQYDDSTNVQTLTSGRYAVNWIYRGVSIYPKIYIVLGNGDYTLSQAEASLPDGLPSIIQTQATLVGKIVVRKNENTATEIVQASTTNFSQYNVNDHNSLLNLQGGTSNEYYHLTAAQVNAIVPVGGTTGQVLAKINNT